MITPWNSPFILAARVVLPALAMGNAVVLKPDLQTPVCGGYLLAKLFELAGIPAGVFTVVPGGGDIGAVLVENPDVNMISFTGSTITGRKVGEAAGRGLKKVALELGGNNAAIVFADCDFEETLDGLSEAVFLNTGQVCLCAERVYVERSMFEQFVEALKHKAEKLRQGAPSEQTTELGPLISAQHRAKVLSYYKLAHEEGATVVTGGGVPEFGNVLDKGFYVQPTIYTGLAESARCVKEEIFGPVCHVAPFDSEEEAIVMANDTEYGLAASVWTTNLKRGHRVAQSMNAGITWVNCWFLRDLRTPFGGVGLSGIGREGGMHSLNFYSELNNICIRL